ncbi:MAG: tetratricopeptide repeat protein [Anaerolineae bacterium]|nr:tetratricopeptide repeat protein [Anaerolineae bacterium]
MSLIGHGSGWFGTGGHGEEAVRVWVDMTLRALPPEIAEAARICALPAQFDMRLFVLLSGKNEAEAITSLAQLAAADLARPQTPSSYIFHKAVRQYLLDMWRTREHWERFEVLTQRMASYYLSLAYEQTLRLRGPEYDKALESLDRLYPNIQAAWEGVLATGKWAFVRDFAALMDIYHTHRKRWMQNILWLEQAIAACTHLGDRMTQAALYNSLGVSYIQLPEGDEIKNTHKAIAAYQEALKTYTPKTVPADYAMVQNNLGNAYARLSPAGDDANLRRSIACYTEAARFWTVETAPFSYAMVQNNLGNTYIALKEAERGENLQKAVACYQKALKVYVAARDAGRTSSGYANLQFKLGKSYAVLPGGWQAEKRSVNLHRAIACYKAVLTIYTLEQAPFDYVQTQIELGNIYMQLKEGDPARNLKDAIACYKEALRFWLRDVSSIGSLQPAIAQEKLTSAYLDLARLYVEQGRIEHIHALYKEIRELYADEEL